MNIIGIKPTKEEFEAYVRVRDGGETNMLDVNKVIELSDHELSRENCLYIISENNFVDLAHEYGVKI